MNPTSTPTQPLTDAFGRSLTYLRLAVTDRCNLRCTYCMPAEGLNWQPRKQLLSFEEMLRLVGILHAAGINKVRLTGGEPLLRKDIGVLLEGLASFDNLEVAITTNGTAGLHHLDLMEKLGIRSINLSLDTLDPVRFAALSRRDEFDKVKAFLDRTLNPGWNLKINAVMLPETALDEIRDLSLLAEQHAVSVRFLEEMPFNGHRETKNLRDHAVIQTQLEQLFPGLAEIDPSPSGTARRFSHSDWKGSVGIIPAFTRSFCGTCNRLRITPDGLLRSCLYAKGGVSLKDLLREGASDSEVLQAVQHAVANKAIDGHAAAAASPIRESMAQIGG